MDGMMQAAPLTLDLAFGRAERLFADKTIVTATATGVERTTYGHWAERTRRLAGVLDDLGVSDDGRVATFAWNTARHLELYFAVPCSGRVLHTLNIRLFPEQVVFVANHAEDEVVFVDRSLLKLLWPLIDDLKTIKHVVVMDDGVDDEIPDDERIRDYEELLASASAADRFGTVTDENQAAAMCYTSGTTGNPKGVVYSHRSMTLHAMATMLADTMALSERDVVLPVVPMFHANAWGLAHACAMTGSTLVLPGPNMAPPKILELMAGEAVTLAAGVPTIWMGVLDELRQQGTSLPALDRILCGGSAVPRALSEAYREVTGKPILQAWGMTETSPIGSVARVKSTLEDRSEDELAELRASIGVIAPLVDCRIAGEDGEALAWDGKAQGELQVRGPWIAAGYYDDERSPVTEDGWLMTGDVATIDAEGYIRLVDRTKDVIKSGGEWISSVELENEIMAHPDVAEAAVIGVADEKWGERPLACVVAAEGKDVDPEALKAFLDGRVAKWWVPERVELIDEVPKTSVGKFSKKDLRERFTA